MNEISTIRPRNDKTDALVEKPTDHACMEAEAMKIKGALDDGLVFAITRLLHPAKILATAVVAYQDVRALPSKPWWPCLEDLS